MQTFSGKLSTSIFSEDSHLDIFFMYRLSDQCSAPRAHNSFPLTRKGVKLNYMWQVSVILPSVHQNEQHCQAKYNTMGTEYEHETKKGLNKKKNPNKHQKKTKKKSKMLSSRSWRSVLVYPNRFTHTYTQPTWFSHKGHIFDSTHSA